MNVLIFLIFGGLLIVLIIALYLNNHWANKKQVSNKSLASVVGKKFVNNAFGILVPEGQLGKLSKVMNNSRRNKDYLVVKVAVILVSTILYWQVTNGMAFGFIIGLALWMIPRDIWSFNKEVLWLEVKDRSIVFQLENRLVELDNKDLRNLRFINGLAEKGQFCLVNIEGQTYGFYPNNELTRYILSLNCKNETKKLMFWQVAFFLLGFLVIILAYLRN